MRPLARFRALAVLPILLFISSQSAFALAHWTGFCEQGGHQVLTGSVLSVTKVQQSYPQATLTVYLPGTLTKAAIYSDNINTPLSNPFTCSATTGFYSFYALTGSYDLAFAGGGIPAPFTISSVSSFDPAGSLTLTPPVIISGNTATNILSLTQTGTGSVFTASGGNIGLGTQTPVVPLQIINDGGPLGTDLTIRLQTTSATDPGITLYSGGVFTGLWASGNNSSGTNCLFCAVSASGSHVFNVSQNGNVGVNVPFPSAKMEINGTFLADGASTFGSSATIAGPLSVTSGAVAVTSTGASTISLTGASGGSGALLLHGNSSTNCWDTTANGSGSSMVLGYTGSCSAVYSPITEVTFSPNGTTFAQPITVPSCVGCTTTVYCLGTGTNTITCPGIPPPGSYGSGGLSITLQAGGTNTGATTLNVNSLGAKNIFANGVALTGGELVIGNTYTVTYDGTRFNLNVTNLSLTPPVTITGTTSTYILSLTQSGSGLAFTTTGTSTMDRLNVNSNTSTTTLTAFQSGAGAAFTAAGGHIGLGTQSPSANNIVHIYGDNPVGNEEQVRIQAPGGGATGITNYSGSVYMSNWASSTAAALDVATSSLQHAITARQSGLVGINQVSPAFQLDVNGTLNVTGASTFNAITVTSCTGCGGGGGSFGPVGITVPPALLTVTPSSITTAGTFAFGLANFPQDAVLIGSLAAGTGPPTVRLLSGADIPLPTLFIQGGVIAKAPVTSMFITGLGSDGQLIQSTISASNLTNGTSGSGAVLLVTAPTIVTPIIAANGWANAQTSHIDAAHGGVLTTLNNVTFPSAAADNQVYVGSGSNILAAVTIPACPDMAGNHLNYSSHLITCGTSGGGSIIPGTSVQHSWSGGEQAFTHNLNMVNPPYQCYLTSTKERAQLGSGTTTNTTAITYLSSNSATDVTCNFVSGSGATGAQGIQGIPGTTGSQGPPGPAPGGSGAVIVTAGVASTLSGTTTTLMHGNAAGAPTFSTVTSADVSASLRRGPPCDINIGDHSSATSVTTAQLGPQKYLCFIPVTGTVVEVNVAADAGTSSVIVGRNRNGTVVNLTSSALATAASGAPACSNTGGTTGINPAITCTNTLQNTTLNAGDFLELVSGTSAGTPNLFTIHIIYDTTN